ncbi:BRCA1 C Terminus domain-containing protein [Colletotrichum karsti]|uniref:BRCA1 C Terminus domain-containing protein n=1 Tax=Colletotrichum karsti TaxID=1095194 RepID=A0A9P6I675_9PEZI|nr:BRCA1 C Terminus domain-containing protein [Colletotrichum karsti]KAF9878033.1 BRCA1 C Terminus domain-containing protein [Colletotrichum karsti]
MDSSFSREASEPPFDPAHPFKGVVVCCTSIPPDQRTEIAKKTEELGGIHKYDLTPDVTHLVVGDYDTPKYRHVAKERTDIKAMDATWIDAMGKLWMADANIDFAALEKEHQLRPFETCGEVPDATDPTQAKRGSLLLCMTGFDDPDERNKIIDRIQESGGTYTGDLTKRVSHLIVYKPEGKKFKAARNWGIRTVSLAWVDQTIERGMILDEQCFDPVMPPEEQGQGAWNRVNPRRVSLGKRSRSGVGEDGQRKLRKTASMKLGSQRDSIWNDLLGSKPSGESSAPQRSERIEVQDSGVHDAMAQPAPDEGIFSACHFFMAGFETWKSKILSETIGSLGGKTYAAFEELVAEAAGPRSLHKFLIVPQEAQPSTHFRIPPAHVDKVQVVTEFFVERCIHNKTLCDPNTHALGRPFPGFPIPGFQDLSICTAGFTGIDLLHVEKTIRQIGAKYAARLNEATSVLVCKSLAETRKEKLKFAFDSNIPIVSSEWLWGSVSSGYNVPVKRFMFPELQQNPDLKAKPRAKEQLKEQTKQPIQRTRSEPIPHMPKKPASRHTSVAGIDPTAFQHEQQKPAAPMQTATKEDSAASFQFQTAKTHQMDSFGGGTVAAPPSNSSSHARNESTTSERPAKQKLARTTSVADSMDDATPISEAEAGGVVVRHVVDEPMPPTKHGEKPQLWISRGDEIAGEIQLNDEARLRMDAHDDRMREVGIDQAIISAATGGISDEKKAQLDAAAALCKRSRELENMDEDEKDEAQLEFQREELKTAKFRNDCFEKVLEYQKDEDEARAHMEAELKADRDAKKAAEKEEITERLTNLIEARAMDRDIELPRKEEHPPHRRPRKRPLGRVISNASAASSGSAELDMYGQPTKEKQEEQEPPSTQIQYQDPGAQQHRARIMSKMMGEDPKPATSQGKTKIGGFEFEGEAGGMMSRRQTRRNA